MKRLFCGLFFAGLLANGFNLNGEVKEMSSEQPKVRLATNYGEITLQLDAEKAPKTVQNFLRYVDEKHYDGTIFHRVIDNFMIQGGGFTEQMAQKGTHAPIQNEADNGLKNSRGAIAMARTSDVNSATSQFFINTADNAFLDFTTKTPQGYGYCVFGKVIEGSDVVAKIGKVKTGVNGGHRDVPVETVKIISAERLN